MNDPNERREAAAGVAFLFTALVLVVLSVAVWLADYSISTRLALQAIVFALIGCAVYAIVQSVPEDR